MIVMNIDERNREIDNRERLIQTYLLISGLLMAFLSRESLGNSYANIIQIFVLMLTVGILYYIFVARTKIYSLVDCLAATFSFLFAGLLYLIFVVYSGSKTGFTSFILYGVIFTFSLISPEANEKIDAWVKSIANKCPNKIFEENNQLYIYILFIVLFMFTIFYVIWMNR